jgi:ABC-2 type transport system permease protein
MKSFSKYWSIFQITLLNSLAYPGELIGRSLMIIPFMWVFHQLWKITFNAAGTDVMSGLTLGNTLWYLMLAETIELGRPPLARTMSENVKDGSIAYILNKPYDFLLYQFSATMGAQCHLWRTDRLVAGRRSATSRRIFDCTPRHPRRVDFAFLR